jgi:AhpD family alkylhydroperoxidase
MTHTGTAAAPGEAAMKDITSLVPGFAAALERAPGTLSTYRDLARALEHSVLPLRCRAQIGLLIAQAVGCEYCAWVHSCLADAQGLNAEDVLFARAGSSRDRHEAAILRVAHKMVAGDELRDALEFVPSQARSASCTVLAEISAHVAFAILTCYVLQGIAPKLGESVAPSGRAA